MKKCKRCENIKPFSDYYRQAKTADGYAYRCKACQKATHPSRLSQKERHPGKKRCSTCKDWLTFDNFRSTKNGLSASCLSCKPYVDFTTKNPIVDGKKQCIKCKEWREVPRCYRKASTQPYEGRCKICMGVDPEFLETGINPKLKKHRKTPEAKLARRKHYEAKRKRENRLRNCVRFWKPKTPEQLANETRSRTINAAIREKRVRKATPDCLPTEHKQAIKDIYLDAKDLRECGQNVHVDHIIPLKGKNVSGLHVPWNLQILPAHQNLRKSNNF